MRRFGGVGAATAVGLGAGFLADLAFGDPVRWHPVAGFGRMAAALERRIYADEKGRGAAFEGALVGGVVGAGLLTSFLVRDRPLARALVTASTTWAVLGGRSLVREATAIADALDEDDVAAARARVRNLVGRDPESLDADGIARATLESLAENTSDAVVAPLFWGAVAGLPGLVGYRAINTLDAMVGHRSERYRNFGWAAARLDDVVNWVPARLAAGLAVLAAPLVTGHSSQALRAVQQQSGQHPSPNGGVVEAAFAGALGVTLGGQNSYGGVLEDRGVLGFGPVPRPSDIARGNRLALVVSAGAALLAVGVAWGRRR
ncbi:MAG: cobalamin biosynthesis protein [Propionicimonas sp.]